MEIYLEGWSQGTCLKTAFAQQAQFLFRSCCLFGSMREGYKVLTDRGAGSFLISGNHSPSVFFPPWPVMMTLTCPDIPPLATPLLR